ncbi:MAG: YggS family pyridoxal phosphate-dependent enzyme [Actinomycetota bacterium]
MSLESVGKRVEEACLRAGRDPGEVTIVAVSKGRAPEEILGLYELGHRDFGENRADEMDEKASRLPADIRWHFVGHLQSNKARVVRPTASFLHSLDRMSLAKAWLKGPGDPPPAYLQVNIGREPQKFGVEPEEAPKAAVQFADLGIALVGVMAILPIVEEPEDARPYFRELREVGRRTQEAVPGARGLSMGMTDDFEVAVEEGATVIRVGRAIFDENQTTPR